jgi:hypothetical protein
MGSSPRVDVVHRNSFQETGAAIPTSTNDETALRFVSCGKPVLHHEICIVENSGKRLPDRQQGHIIFRGPSATVGYFRNEEATEQLIDQDGWLHSGDVGYTDGGHLFVTGRTKDVIIRGGRNLYPHEVEAIVGALTGVRTGCVAAFGLVNETRGTEQFVIVAETRLADRESRAELQRQITAIVAEQTGETPDRVVLAHPGVIPKTSSGKIRRSATRDALQAGNLETKTVGIAIQWLRLASKALGGLFLQWSKRLAQVLYSDNWGSNTSVADYCPEWSPRRPTHWTLGTAAPCLRGVSHSNHRIRPSSKKPTRCVCGQPRKLSRSATHDERPPRRCQICRKRPPSRLSNSWTSNP